jgi:uncharacterized protein
MSANKDFLGTGWAFPPTFLKAPHTVAMVSHEQDVKQSLYILLSTQLSERVQRSDFGCDIPSLLFENVSTTTLTRITDVIKQAIIQYEHRIILEKVQFDFLETEGRLDIDIHYTIRSTNSRHNYVYPYYIKEGTHVETT